MKQINMRFLPSVFVLTVFGVTGAFAAPSVKMLGTNAARIGTNTAVVKSNPGAGVSNSSQQQRLSSVRAKTMTGAMPVSMKSTTANTGADSRISLGSVGLNKYLHSVPTNVAAQQSGPSQAPARPGVSEQDFTNLTDRVQDLEDDMENKQDVLSVGTGLVLEDNTISLNEEYSQLPTQVSEMQTTLNTKVNQSQVTATVNDALNNYYTKYEIDGMISSQGGVDIKTIYDAAAGNRKYVTVVDTFSESIFD